MPLRQSVKWLPAEKILTVAKAVPITMFPIAIAFAVALVAVASGCAIDKDYEYVSSFLEVMIAVNASCSYICSSDSWKKRQLAWIGNGGAAVSGLDERQVNELSVWYVGIDAVNEKIRGMVRPLGIAFAVIGALMLVVGFSKGMRPYVVLSAIPLVFYFLSILAVNQLWHLLCRNLSLSSPATEPNGPEPVDEGMDMESVMGCTGPASFEEGTKS